MSATIFVKKKDGGEQKNSSNPIIDTTIKKQTIEDVKREHWLHVLETADEARDSSLYEDYLYECPDGDKDLMLFAARRRGRSHIESNIPCQDYCTFKNFGEYSVLVDADGVSACKNSDKGSKLACAAVIELVEDLVKHFDGKEKLIVSNLISMKFREKLAVKWRTKVIKYISEQKDSSEVSNDEVSSYGSTVLFAVISPNYYILGNLGDGQVLVFNDIFGVKLRNIKKESPAVRCLVHATCAREDMLVRYFPRAKFNGILLSTDGMHDILQPGQHFYRYAKQLKARFTMYTDTPEPLQPFCYMEYGQPLKEISQIRTMDDCSIVLALDNAANKSNRSEIHSYLTENTDRLQIERWTTEGSFYSVEMNDGEYQVMSTHELVDMSGLELSTAKIIKPVEVRRRSSTTSSDEKKNIYYHFYEYHDEKTLEDLFLSGELRLRKPLADRNYDIVSIYSKYSRLKKELDDKGLALAPTSNFLITVSEGELHVKEAAIVKKREKQELTEADNYFSALIGAVSCGGKSEPLFDTGYLDEGHKIERIDSAGKLGSVVRNKEAEGRQYLLRNNSGQVWTLSDDTKVADSGCIEIISGMEFCIGDTFDKSLDTFYTIIVKEEL